MLKKEITYTDYNGQKRTEEFMFNLNKAEVAEMELSEKGGLAKYIEEIVKEEDGKKIVGLFKDVILMAYGEKSEDGRYFLKNDEMRERFAQSAAYSELFMELATDADAAAAFVNAVVPKFEEGGKPKEITNPPK